MSTAARILAVSDSFDAMTADRSERAALSTEAAVDELHANAGTQFDAAVVDAFLSVLKGLDDSPGDDHAIPDGGAAVVEA